MGVHSMVVPLLGPSILLFGVSAGRTWGATREAVPIFRHSRSLDYAPLGAMHSTVHTGGRRAANVRAPRTPAGKNGLEIWHHSCISVRV